MEHLGVCDQVVGRGVKSGELLEVHIPEDKPAKRGEQQIFQREKRQVDPGWRGQENA